MKIQIILLLLLVFIALTGYTQIRFKNGYFIDDSNNRIECLIRDVDWRSNPTGFE